MEINWSQIGVFRISFFLLQKCFFKNPTAIYDGSWTEWATLNKELN